MIKYEIIKIKENKYIVEKAAKWFHDKWDVPEDAYIESMEDDDSISQWYVVVHNDKIIAGVGVIENDFHNRKDLTPNICALYVEEKYRKQGLAGDIIKYVCDDFATMGTKKLYLITEHTSFYEKYSWEFLCMVECEDTDDILRMYVKEI